jgi:TolB-like protein
MQQSKPSYRLWLHGPFRLEGPGGGRIALSSKRGQALLAMLATAGAGERTRAWLQDRLWGSRGAEQAQASLRRELSNLKKVVNAAEAELLLADHGRVWLDLALVEIDARSLDGERSGELLEGLDLAGEDGFEDWLREERARSTARPAPAPQPVAPLAASPAEFALRPAIAVLPFASTDPDPARSAMAEGLSEDLTDRLAKLRWLPVIARSSAAAQAALQPDPRAAGAALGARYVVEGMIREAPSGPQLSASLTDTESGQVLWSDRMTLPEGGDPEGFAALLATIAATLDLKVDQREQTRAAARAPEELAVRELIWRGRWHLNRLTRQDSLKARECFDQALALEPNSPEALIQATWVRLWELWVTRGADEEVRAVRAMAQRAIIADYDDARGHMLAGIAEIWLRQPLRAEALLRRAIELNPSLVMAHAQLGCALHLTGDHIAAIERLRFAMRLSPNDHDLFFTLGELAGAYLFSGEPALALDYAEQTLARRTAYWLAHVIKIKALVELGRIDQAAAALVDLSAANTGFREEFIDWMPFIDGTKRAFLKEGLNRAANCAD